MYSACAVMEALACVVFRFVKRSKPYAAFYHFFFGICMMFALSFDPHRIVLLMDDSTSYVHELARWWYLYEPSYETSNCGGLVTNGAFGYSNGVLVMPDQNCYFNSYESAYMIMVMGLMTVQAAQPRAPT